MDGNECLFVPITLCGCAALHRATGRVARRPSSLFCCLERIPRELRAARLAASVARPESRSITQDSRV